LRTKLEGMEREGVKSKLSFAKAEADRIIREGRVPAALASKLEKLFAVGTTRKPSPFLRTVPPWSSKPWTWWGPCGKS